MSPALKGKDIPPGAWSRPEPKPPSASDQKCPTCGYWLSQQLVDDGEARHPFCPPATEEETMSTREDRQADAREWARELTHADVDENGQPIPPDPEEES